MPNALAVAPLATEAKVPTVTANAATAVITTKSPYFARVSLTIPQTTEIFGRWAATKGGIKRAFTSVSDYGPGFDAEESFTRGFTEAGGTIVGSVRVPLANPDVVPFLQRVLDQKPDALYAFIPGGTQPPAFVKAFNEVGLAKAGIKMMPSEEATDEATLQEFLGDLRGRTGHGDALHGLASLRGQQGLRRRLAHGLRQGQGPGFLRGRCLGRHGADLRHREEA